MTQYQVKLAYSEVNLDPIKIPVYHQEIGCQFDKDDIREDNKCPVCENKRATLIQDNEHIVQIEIKNDKQLLRQKKTNTLYQCNKQSYSSNISQDKEVKSLQQQFNNNIVKKKQITLTEIFDMNNQRNVEIIQLLRNLPEGDERVPIVMAAIEDRLILFYHKYKIKLEFDIYDDKGKIRPKIKSSTHGLIVQVAHNQDQIYFLFQRQQSYFLYKGDLKQIFADRDAKQMNVFFIQQVPTPDIQSSVQLFQAIDNRLYLIGRFFYLEVQDQINQKLESPFFLPELNLESQTMMLSNNIVFVANNDIQTFNINPKKKVEARWCFRHLFQLPYSDPIKIPISSNYDFDNSIKLGDKLLVFLTKQLTETRLISTIIQAGIDQPFQIPLTITNHSSFMTPVKIPTTTFMFDQLSCKLIGLRLPPYPNGPSINDTFPAILVYNHKTSSIEIELI